MQNIIVASTPSRVNADAYLKVELITIGESQHEVSTYEAAPQATCKGVIRNVDIGQSQAELDRNTINSRNPLALAVKRIKNTETVVISFDGYKVPNFVRYGPSLVKCSLYLRQRDNCYACGRMGHRADVCPTPENVICRGCGVNNTDSTHACTPKCGLCGGQHPTADKTCKHRFQIRLRRRERAQAAKKDDATPRSSTRRSRSRRRSATRGSDFPAHGRSRNPSAHSSSTSRSRSNSRGRVKDRSKLRSTSGSSSRSRSRGPRSRISFKDPPGSRTWADCVRGSTEKVTGGPSPEHYSVKLSQLEKENAAMRSIIQQLRTEIAELKKSSKSHAQPGVIVTDSPQPMEVPVARMRHPRATPPKGERFQATRTVRPTERNPKSEKF
ncbi:hypothetical protein MTO96_044736 [Rhipicephalus appendiculatus]